MSNQKLCQAIFYCIIKHYRSYMRTWPTPIRYQIYSAYIINVKWFISIFFSHPWKILLSVLLLSGASTKIWYSFFFQNSTCQPNSFSWSDRANKIWWKKRLKFLGVWLLYITCCKHPFSESGLRNTTLK